MILWSIVQCLFLMRGLNSKIGQSTVVIKTVCCFPRKALSSALLMVYRAVHVVEEQAARCSGCAQRWRRWRHLRCFFCKTPSSAKWDESQILIRDYRWKLCRSTGGFRQRSICRHTAEEDLVAVVAPHWLHWSLQAITTNHYFAPFLFHSFFYSLTWPSFNANLAKKNKQYHSLLIFKVEICSCSIIGLHHHHVWTQAMSCNQKWLFLLQSQICHV